MLATCHWSTGRSGWLHSLISISVKVWEKEIEQNIHSSSQQCLEHSHWLSIT